MILKPFFRKHFLLTFGVFIAVLGICAFTTSALMRFQMDRFFKSQADELIRQIEGYSGDKFAFVKELNEINKRTHSPVQIEIKDENETPTPAFGPSVVRAFEIDHKKFNFVLSIAPPPDRMGPPPAAGSDPKFPHAPGGHMHPPVIPFLSMIFAVLLASVLSVFLIYRSIRDKAELAKEILGKMQHGDLKARFPISRWDEAAPVFTLYNQMADEIERLVERLRQNEKMRVSLLQELAHDLRTPVSSLHSVLETIRYDEKSLDEKTKEELKDVALHETKYLKRLVEDLLFLALMLEPKYKGDSEEVFVRELLINQMTAAASGYPNIKFQLIESQGKLGLTTVGSPHLIRRMFRNAFENAFSFAKSTVTAVIHEADGQIQIIIRDDGPGLSPEAIRDFGKKKSSTRYQDAHQEGRISVGLGSVIIQTIATAHAGHAEIHNALDASGNIIGAELVISIRAALKAAAG